MKEDARLAKRAGAALVRPPSHETPAQNCWKLGWGSIILRLDRLLQSVPQEFCAS
jgi:hypothetical protein